MSTKSRLYYIHDPMCSWCWAFRPTWKNILQQLPANIDVIYILGGLAADTDVPMPMALQRQIQEHWRRIQQVVPKTSFNYNFWSNCTPRRATYPACRAVIAAKNQGVSYEMDIIHAIQQAYYLHSKNPSDDNTLITLADEIGLNTGLFTKELNSPETQQQLRQEIDFSQSLNTPGFPSLMFESKGNIQSIPHDYNDACVTLQALKNTAGE